MKRFYEANASDTPPSPPASPSYGYPQNGNRSKNLKPTKLGAYWFHMITEEFMAVIEGAGLEPSETNLHQLADIFADFRARAANAEVFQKAAEAAATRAEDAAAANRNAVTYVAQTLSAEEQAQARTNIGALGKTEAAASVAWGNVTSKPTTVTGYGMTFASTAEAKAGTDTTKPMNAARTKEAILALAPAPDLSGHATKTELSEVDAIAQGIYAAFVQFNQENGIS